MDLIRMRETFQVKDSTLTIGNGLFEDWGPSLDAQSQTDEKRKGFSAADSTAFPRGFMWP